MFGSSSKSPQRSSYSNQLNITYTYDMLADHFNCVENWRGDIGKTNKNSHKIRSCDTYNSYIASKFMIIGFFVSLILLFPLLADHEQERNNSHMQFECNTEQQ